VDESFADRLQPGDRFLLDGRCLEFRTREADAVVVEEVAGRPRTPVWSGEGWPLSPELARRLYLLRTRAAEALRDGPGALADLLRLEYGLDGDALAEVVAHFEQQEAVSEIPDVTTLLIEVVGRERGLEVYLHTPLNRPGNDALARVAVARLVRDHGQSVSSIVADLGFVLVLRSMVPDVPGLVRSLLAVEGFAAEVDRALLQCESLRARFGRVAQTGLMLLRQPEGRRRRVGGAGWGERRLFESVRLRDADFVLVRQALRELRQDLCDLPQALEYAHRLPALTLRCRRLFRPSPFAAAWTQAEVAAIETVLTPGEALRRLHAELTGDAGSASPG
jgi:ATP-dependent Lhr-like helicase